MKKPIIYLIIALVVAGVVFILENPSRPRVSDSTEGYFIPNFDSANVARIEVDQLIDGASIRRTGDGWEVAELITPIKKELLEKEGQPLPEESWQPADPQRVTGALGVFGGLDRGVLVSDNPEKQSLFQVDKTGLSVRAFAADGKPVFEVIIGKNGPDFASNYIRKTNENTVYLVHRPIVGVFSSRATGYLVKKSEEEPKP